ncbi:uncharacterized protein LOC129245282 [Anastrepha obliqua]|uniref:uncharacterized protein LOC129245282 n=1 Tax=Anastrepha obliqua TaxID=95512 RepID=UPI00240A6A51|nr:uncharacterized protein LOC129245282 [Anastrepha obliqua]
MLYKACVYKGCENYTYNSLPCGHKQFTIFRFPKDPRRYEQWMKRGNVQVGLPETQMHMCSEHFDDKYLIRSSRRMCLTNTAVPYPYCEGSSDIECRDNANKEFEDALVDVAEELDSEIEFSTQRNSNDRSALIRLKESSCEDDDEDVMLEFEKLESSNPDYCVESTTMREEEHVAEMVNEYDVAIDYDDDLLTEVVPHTVHNEKFVKRIQMHAAKKRKPSSDSDETQEPTSSKICTSKITTLREKGCDNVTTVSKRSKKQDSEEHNKHMRLQNKKPTHDSESQKIDPDTLIDPQSVTSFVLKGEEYVQMTKGYYVEEKLELTEKLKKYENILRTLKHNLLDLELP